MWEHTEAVYLFKTEARQRYTPERTAAAAAAAAKSLQSSERTMGI